MENVPIYAFPVDKRATGKSRNVISQLGCELNLQSLELVASTNEFSVVHDHLRPIVP